MKMSKISFFALRDVKVDAFVFGPEFKVPF